MSVLSLIILNAYGLHFKSTTSKIAYQKQNTIKKHIAYAALNYEMDASMFFKDFFNYGANPTHIPTFTSAIDFFRNHTLEVLRTLQHVEVDQEISGDETTKAVWTVLRVTTSQLAEELNVFAY